MASNRPYGGWLSAVAVYACFSLAGAQSTCSTPTQITDLRQTNAFQNCDIFSGNLTIQSITTTGLAPQATQTISLPFRQISGSLTFSDLAARDVDGAPLDFDIQLSNLEVVELDLTFNNMTLDAMPEMKLSQAGSLSFTNVTIDDTGADDVVYASYAFRNMIFQDCAGLNRIEAVQRPNIRIEPSSAAFVATGNRDLSRIELSSYTMVKTDVIIGHNAPDISVNLVDIANGSLDLGQVASFEANALQYLSASVLGSGSIISDNKIVDLNIPYLVTVQDTSLEISSNIYLASIEFDRLMNVTLLNISSNSQLERVSLQEMETIGTLSISGPIKSVSFEDPEGVNIVNQVDIRPEDDAEDVCDSIPKLDGNYTCHAPASSDSSDSQGSSPNDDDEPEDNSSGGGGLSSGAKIGIGVGVGLVGLILIVAALFFIFRGRRQKQRTSRSPEVETYSMAKQRSMDRSPARYSKVPAASESVDEPSPEGQRPFSDQHADYWSPPPNRVPTPEGHVEMEEQQGPRHEMDARSINDIDLGEDDGEDTRSLQDIERSHNK